MKRASRFAYAVVAISIATFAIIAGPGCSSDDDSGAAPDDDASTGSPDVVVCQGLETARNGGPCYPVGPALCFQECTTGGCVCTQDKMHPGADAGIWVCQSDNSCLPDAPPVDFDAPDFVPDSSFVFDAGVDADIDDAGADADAE